MVITAASGLEITHILPMTFVAHRRTHVSVCVCLCKEEDMASFVTSEADLTPAMVPSHPFLMHT